MVLALSTLVSPPVKSSWVRDPTKRRKQMNNSVEYLGFKAEINQLCQNGILVGFSNEDIIRALKAQIQMEEQYLDTRDRLELQCAS